MQSESLRRLDAADPAIPNRETVRQEIERQVAEYLARGGTIHQVTSDQNRRPTFDPRDREARFRQHHRGETPHKFNAGPRERS